MKPLLVDNDHYDLMLFQNRYSLLVSWDEIVVVIGEKSKEKGSDNNEVWLARWGTFTNSSRTRTGDSTLMSSTQVLQRDIYYNG